MARIVLRAEPDAGALSAVAGTVTSEPSLGWMLVLVASEAALGITIGLAVAFLMETLLVAAQVFGMQAGYSYASTINPTTDADSSVLLVLAELMGGLLFFALGLDRDRSCACSPPAWQRIRRAPSC